MYYSRRHFFKISDISNLATLLRIFFDSPLKIRKIRNIADFKNNISLNNLYKFDIYTKGTQS